MLISTLIQRMRNSNHNIFSLIMWLVYLVAYLALLPENSQVANAISIFPIVNSGWYYGKRGGFIGSLAIIAFINIMAYSTMGIPNVSFAIVGSIIFLTIGISVGYLHDIRIQLDAEVEKRKKYARNLREKNAEIQKQKRYFEALNAGSPIAIVTLNDKFLIDSCNPSFANLFEYTEAEIIGKKIDDLIIPEGEKENSLEITSKATKGSIVHHFGQRITKNKIPVEVEIFGVPVMVGKKQVGTLGLYHNITELKEAQKSLLAANKQLETLASNDGLTGISNRRSFDNKLEEEWRRSKRSKDPVSLILFDIDNFKDYNDHYGHQAGDEVLRKVGKLLLESKLINRPGDLTARYGGEEFAIILSGATLEYARNVAEKFRKAIMGLKIKHEYSKVENHKIVTISSGVTSLQAQRKSEASQIIKLADQALYLAKENGRNRVEMG